MTLENLKRFIENEILSCELKLDTGITESNSINGISVGVSHETNEDGDEIYIYNLFDYDEYVNISSVGTPQNILPDEVLIEIQSAWERVSKANFQEN